MEFYSADDTFVLSRYFLQLPGTIWTFDEIRRILFLIFNFRTAYYEQQMFHADIIIIIVIRSTSSSIISIVRCGINFRVQVINSYYHGTSYNYLVDFGYRMTSDSFYFKFPNCISWITNFLTINAWIIFLSNNLKYIMKSKRHNSLRITLFTIIIMISMTTCFWLLIPCCVS